MSAQPNHTSPSRTIRIALVGDYNPQVTAHRAIPIALELAGRARGTDVAYEWLHTTSLGDDIALQLHPFHGIWCVPASPYASTEAAVKAIRLAREQGIPFLGTCGSYQHAMLEYAEAVWNVAHPAHAETDPDAANPVIAPLACGLVEVTDSLRFAENSALARAYGRLEAHEGYHCRYGLSPAYRNRLQEGPLRAVAWDAAGDIRAVELEGHPFFLGTLFQPERAALAGTLPPAVRAFVEAAEASRHELD